MQTRIQRLGLVFVLTVIAGSFLHAPSAAAQPQDPCAGLPSAPQLRDWLVNAAAGNGIDAALGPGTDAGGLFGGARMWGAVVNRQGELCAATTSTQDPTQVWPVSQAIAKAKAYTANSVSLDDFVLSTARLYTFALPGHSLYGLNQSNPFSPSYLAGPSQTVATGSGFVAGGIITFGGGVPLYRNGQIVGGLGVSGDTACADHEIAKRVRDLARLNPSGGPLTDDIVYAESDGESMFQHPLCPNTWRNGSYVGEETP